MSVVDSLKSLHPEVQEYLKCAPNFEIYVDREGVQLSHKILDGSKLARVKQLAQDTITHNHTQAQKKAKIAILSGFFIVPSIALSISSLIGNKIIKSRPVTIAFAITSVLSTLIWLMFRNYPAYLAVKTCEAMLEKKEGTAIDYIAQGASLSELVKGAKLGELLVQVASREKLPTLLMYMALISNCDPDLLNFAFHCTNHLSIKKLSLELGDYSFEKFINEENRVGSDQKVILCMFGAPAQLLLHFAADKETAEFAIEKGAKPEEDPHAMLALFHYACETKNLSLMNYLVNDLKVIPSDGDIDNYPSWNSTCAAVEDLFSTVTIPLDSRLTPFELYLTAIATEQPNGSATLDRSQLSTALKCFGLTDSTAQELANSTDPDEFFIGVNEQGIRIRKSICRNIFVNLDQSA